MEEPEFRKHAGEALTSLQRDLMLAGDDYGFQSSLNGGTITITFHRHHGAFTVTGDPNTGQVKLLAGARTYKLDWDIVENAFVHTETSQSLKDLVEQAISKHVKQDVQL
jgi:frataxin-like iron-binding protein CyaY